MRHDDFERAARYWTDRDAAQAASERMPREELEAAIDAFLAERTTCALATAAPSRESGAPLVRCTPLEYGWHDHAFWVFSEGGLKFRGLEPQAGSDDAPVALSVFDTYAGFGKLKSLQAEGVATVVDPASPEFAAAAKAKHIPASHLPKLASVLHLIKVTPTSFDYLDSSLKQKGYATRQHLDCEAASI